MSAENISSASSSSSTIPTVILWRSSAPSADITYTFVRELGKGTFGEVSLFACSSGPDDFVAVKQLEYGFDVKCVLAGIELGIHETASTAGHPNIIRLKNHTSVDGILKLYMEFADGGSLWNRLAYGQAMSVHRSQHYFRQLVDGLEYLHAISFVHRDLKPENILLTSTDVLKISDFGSASRFNCTADGQELELYDFPGTPAYMPPESIERRAYKGTKLDIWSAGVILMHMLTGTRPWTVPSALSPRYHIWQQYDFDEKQPWTTIHPFILDLLRMILRHDPRRRAFISEIKRHPFFNHDYSSRLKRRQEEHEDAPAPQR